MPKTSKKPVTLLLERPTCATCPYFDAGWGQSLADSGVWKEHGRCRRGHALQPYRLPSEWCGEHPDFPEWIKASQHAE